MLATGAQTSLFLLIGTRRSWAFIASGKDQKPSCVNMQSILLVTENKRKPSLMAYCLQPTCLPPDLRSSSGASGTVCSHRLAIGLEGPVAWLLLCPCSSEGWISHVRSRAWLFISSAPYQAGRTGTLRTPNMKHQSTSLRFLPRLKAVFWNGSHLFHRLASHHFKQTLLGSGKLHATHTLQ